MTPTKQSPLSDGMQYLPRFERWRSSAQQAADSTGVVGGGDRWPAGMESSARATILRLDGGS